MLFDEVQTRDYIMSHAKNLARVSLQSGKPSYGIRLDFPDFLSPQFRTLEKYGAQQRQTHGPGNKRNIKFEDASLSLYMDVKLPDDPNWIQVSPEMAS